MLDKLVWEDGDIENYTTGSGYMHLKSLLSPELALGLNKFGKFQLMALQKCV